MRNKIEIYGRISGGSLVYDISHETAEWMRYNNDKDCAILIKLGGDSVAFWQHKYYRGYLLPVISEESYSGNEALAHFEMKKLFLMIHADSFTEIPPQYIDRAIIITDQDKNVLAYIPSTGDLTYQEMHNFILQVEGIMLEFTSGLGADGKAARDKAFKEVV